MPLRNSRRLGHMNSFDSQAMQCSHAIRLNHFGLEWVGLGGMCGWRWGVGTCECVSVRVWVCVSAYVCCDGRVRICVCDIKKNSYTFIWTLLLVDVCGGKWTLAVSWLWTPPAPFPPFICHYTPSCKKLLPEQWTYPLRAYVTCFLILLFYAMN